MPMRNWKFIFGLRRGNQFWPTVHSTLSPRICWFHFAYMLRLSMRKLGVLQMGFGVSSTGSRAWSKMTYFPYILGISLFSLRLQLWTHVGNSSLSSEEVSSALKWVLQQSRINLKGTVLWRLSKACLHQCKDFIVLLLGCSYFTT